MAIIVDPDNLDREQVIFGTNPQTMSIRDVGALVHASASSITGVTSAAAPTQFKDPTGGFSTWGVTSGHFLVLKNGAQAAHIQVSALVNASTLEMASDDAFTGFTADASGLVYRIALASGGSVADGVTEQAAYSFAKEEWRTDTYATVLADDLIRHELPFEGITSEQFEIGGGAAHADWNWFNQYTRKKIRTGGWAEKNTAASTLAEWAGVITLGAADTDAQIYYQQVSAQNAPVDFTFTGAVNESIQTLEQDVSDFRTYLKLFLRKKGKTYGGSEIADIGVTSLNTIVNRFPLTHIADTAIVQNDAAVLASATFRQTVSVFVQRTDGSTTAAGVEFRSDGGAFDTNEVVVGDSLLLGSGTDTGRYFTIASVTNASTLQIAPDVEVSAGFTATEGTLTFDIFTPYRVAAKTTGIASSIEDLKLEVGASAGVAIASSATGGFTAAGVIVGDVLNITSATTDHEGIYQVVSVVSDNRVLVDSTDNPFTAVTAADYQILVKGMYFDYKQEDIALGAIGSVTFDAINPAQASAPTIRRGSGTWSGDGVTIGSILTFASTTSNNRSYTVASVLTSTVRCVAADSSTMVDETEVVGASATAYDAFKRIINGVTYGFHWKLLGNSAALSNAYQFHQHQVRQPTDIAWGGSTFRGDVNDLLLTFATPTGATADMYIDDIGADDTNNVTYGDATGISRSEAFVSSLNIAFNTNLQGDASAKYRMFFTNDDAGDNTGRDFSTKDAITVQNPLGSEIAGNVSAATDVDWTYDYDGNVQRGAASAGTNAPVTIVAIGLATAQYVITTGTITRNKGLTFSLVAPLERNYSNPA
jgi:hypothetical protein